jgi:hypothetical protein
LCVREPGNANAGHDNPRDSLKHAIPPKFLTLGGEIAIRSICCNGESAEKKGVPIADLRRGPTQLAGTTTNEAFSKSAGVFAAYLCAFDLVLLTIPIGLMNVFRIGYETAVARPKRARKRMAAAKSKSIRVETSRKQSHPYD